MSPSLPFRISVLVFLKNEQGEFLLLKRNKAPNKGKWSPVGGKLEMDLGESSFECAIREVLEETGETITTEDLHLFCMISEKSFEGSGHWLMFLFDCKKPIHALPPEIDEGSFAFYSREEINTLDIPETDRECLWRVFDENHEKFVALRADCTPGQKLEIVVEQTL